MEGPGPEKNKHVHLLSLEHNKLGYGADFALYGVAIVWLALYLGIDAPRAHWMLLLSYSLAGLAGWTLVEYLLHRFVLHGLPPFKSWHAQHHERPAALISSPTVFSASLILLLVFLPALQVTDEWRACALTLGLLIGYFAYAVTHHATHHWRGGGWLRQRKLWHARHHRSGAAPACYGVTSSLWDRVLGSTAR